MRSAAAVMVKATTADGSELELPVEYFGPAPGFFGLDQLNVVLVEELNGAGTVAVQAVADAIGSNTVTIEIERQDPPDKPTTPQPLQPLTIVTPEDRGDCSKIVGFPAGRCLALEFLHEWTPATSPHGIAAYQLSTAFGNSVEVAGDVTEFTQWRVEFGQDESSVTACGVEPEGSTFLWSVRAIDARGVFSDTSERATFRIGACSQE